MTYSSAYAPLPQGGEGRVSLNLRPRPLGGEDGPQPALSSAGAGRVRGFIRQPIRQSSVGTPDTGRRTPDAVLRMRLVGANRTAAVTGAEELPGKSNYFIGNDPKQWRTNVPNYAQVKYHNVYPCVDLVYYGNQSGQLEYDFVVAPGADPSAIELDVGAGLVPARTGHPRGAPPQIDPSGDLVVKSDTGEIRFQRPVVYQLAINNGARTSDSGLRTAVQGRYTIDAQNQVRFQVAPYDHSKPLFIDPILSYSTYLGGNNQDVGSGIAVDSSGNAYVTGYTTRPTSPPSPPFRRPIRLLQPRQILRRL